VISLLRTVCALRGLALAARRSGKIKAVLQGTAAFVILLLMIPYSRGYLTLSELRSASFYIVLITAIYTLFSGVEYIVANRDFILKASQPPSSSRQGVRRKRAKTHRAAEKLRSGHPN
jgi:CDP-diacylglycerol--glycerol-3-phosphate 3-phosphatidyltransferase